jgi:hypothetical protein
MNVAIMSAIKTERFTCFLLNAFIGERASIRVRSLQRLRDYTRFQKVSRTGGSTTASAAKGGWKGGTDGPPLHFMPGLLMGAELVAVQVFFLYEPDCHHTVLLESSVELAAIDPECGCGAHLVSTKLL